MKKLLTLLLTLTLGTMTLNAKGEFFLGWEGAQQTWSTSTNRNGYQQGIGFGGRLYAEVSPDLFLGGEMGFSHIETHADISGNMARLQFVMKYHFGNVEVFGGLGAGIRGTPADLNSSIDNDNFVYGGLADIGIAYETDGGFRFEIAYMHYTFEGDIDGNPTEKITTDAVGVRLGTMFESFE